MPHRRSPLLSEAGLVQNEALGAFALWKFCLAFQARDGYAATFHLTFLILPLILHAPTLELLVSTHKSSGLHLFIGKLGTNCEDLLSVHARAFVLRQLTLESLMLGEQSGLLRIDTQTTRIWANSTPEDTRAPVLPERLKRIAPACERLGHWFAGFSDHQVAHAFEVEF